MTEKPTETTTPNIATMTAADLRLHVKELEEKHRARMKALRALMRARQAEEEAAK